MLIGWDKDQDQRSVGPNLGPNCLLSKQETPLTRKELLEKGSNKEIIFNHSPLGML